MRKLVIAVSTLSFVAAGYLYSRKSYEGIPFTHKWDKTRECRAYAKRSGGVFFNGLREPIETETFFSERLATCVQAHTFSPGDYSIVDLSKDYSDNDWLFICGPQGVYETSFADRRGGQWIEDGTRFGRPCETLFK